MTEPEFTEADLPGCVLVVPVLLVWLLFALALLTMPSCGSVGPQVRLSYAAEVRRCEDAEDAIVSRQGTTAEEDASDLAALREECRANLLVLGGP